MAPDPFQSTPGTRPQCGAVAGRLSGILCLAGLAAVLRLSPSFAAHAPQAKRPPSPEFRPAELDLLPGESYPVELFVPSPTGKEAVGQLAFTPGKGLSVRPDARWKGRVPSFGAKNFPSIYALADVEEGEHSVKVALMAGERELSAGALRVNVVRPQVLVIPGQGQLTVRVSSPFRRRSLTGRVLASNPDRFLQDITTGEFRVPPGQVQNVLFPLPGAAPAEGETYDFTITVESYQGYREKRVHKLSFPPQADK